MSFEEDPIEVYFCPPLKSNKNEEPVRSSTGIIEPDLEHPPPPLPKRTSMPEEVENKVVFSRDEDDPDVYFCPPLKINVNEIPRKHESDVINHDLERPPSSSRRTSMTDDMDEKEKSGSNETGVVEYDLEWSPPSSQSSSTTGEYVLSKTARKNNDVGIPDERHQPRRQRQIIQDVYDENHYCLARPTSDDANTIRTVEEEDDEKKSTNCFVTKSKIIIGFLGIFLLFCVVGGIAAYFALGKKGKNN